MTIAWAGPRFQPGAVALSWAAAEGRDRAGSVSSGRPPGTGSRDETPQAGAFSDLLSNAVAAAQHAPHAGSVQGSGQASAVSSEATAASRQDVVNVNGIPVIVRNHSADQRPGRSFLTSLDPSASPLTMASLTRFAAAAGVTPGMEVVRSVALSGPEMATPLVSASPQGIASGYAGNQLAMDYSTANHDAEYGARARSYMTVVGAERQLKQEYGSNIKLVYSHVDGDYIMLTPDDQHYAEMASAEDAVREILADVRNGVVDAAYVRETLAAYGYRL